MCTGWTQPVATQQRRLYSTLMLIKRKKRNEALPATSCQGAIQKKHAGRGGGSCLCCAAEVANLAAAAADKEQPLLGQPPARSERARREQERGGAHPIQPAGQARDSPLPTSSFLLSKLWWSLASCMHPRNPYDFPTDPSCILSWRAHRTHTYGGQYETSKPTRRSGVALVLCTHATLYQVLFTPSARADTKSKALMLWHMPHQLLYTDDTAYQAYILEPITGALAL
jgi:hypothetical protein